MTFDFTYLGSNYHVELFQPAGNAGTYSLMVNNSYIGIFNKYNRGKKDPVTSNVVYGEPAWEAVINKDPYPLQGDDVGVLLDLIIDKEGD